MSNNKKITRKTNTDYKPVLDQLYKLRHIFPENETNIPLMEYMMFKGIPQSEISKYFGVTESTISYHAQKFKKSLNTTVLYNLDPKYNWSKIVGLMLHSIESSEIKDIKPAQRILCAGIAQDKLKDLSQKHDVQAPVAIQINNYLQPGKNEPQHIVFEPQGEENEQK
jgi:hypothetical protein